ncbi:uncharacterized protein F4822DRAFT_319269 [Hypoxylon trugodes]|uniref:uncharacterized protein n=1 Tax=Hypoxylon trugodes TaxID=326681 RepID=UPI00219F4E6B|nr:uncharacterized protein F4822DRAFT_319269 [Hypoxylon trugodes]KAI1386524.1 hypothetical protein F4822DRAFT_319269 [Hypoxylon trugodes]
MPLNSGHSYFFNLPLEIQWWILRYLGPCDQASFLQTCTRARDIVEPLLYTKVYTKIGTYNDSTGLVDLLFRRPHIIRSIHILILDEFHPVAYRQLMAIEFPNLESIIMHHEGEPLSIDDERRRSMNEFVKEQPNLTNLTFAIEPENPSTVLLEQDDAILFRHRKLRRIRISHVDFSAFGGLDADYFPHSDLKRLLVDSCWYTYGALAQLLSPTTKLISLLLGHNAQLPFSERLYPALLGPVRETLRILDLTWRHKIPLGNEGMDFTRFPNLHFLRVPPIYLLGTAYTDNADLEGLIRSRFPPNLKMLLLENIVPRSIRVMDEQGVVFPGYPRPGFTLELTLLPHDYHLIRFLTTEKDHVLPLLKYVLMYYMEFLQDPAGIFSLAKDHGIMLSHLSGSDHINHLLEWLDEM